LLWLLCDRPLAATTRAYAKIIADVNSLDLKDLQRPMQASR